MARGTRTVRTPEKREKFLTALREAGTVTHACEAAGIGKRTAYDWREADTDFAREWDAVIESVADDLEHEAKRRAIEGSDTLLIFLLKGQRPDKYAERTKSEVRATVSVESLLDELD